MPSTGWNVFVASGVALVVYMAVRAEMVLLGIIAGTLTFVTGWVLGYAINQDLLDSMELSRIIGAAGVTVFAIVWTLLYTRQEYILGLIVVCLAWFAAWFTSSMGPIKGDTGAMATIDEPRPPAGAEPTEPLDLGGGSEGSTDAGGGFLRRLFGFGGEESTEPEGYAADPASEADPQEPGREPSESATRGTNEAPGRSTEHRTRRAPGSTTRDSETTTERTAESIFGLGIFYEEDPEPSAGATGPDSSQQGDPKSAATVSESQRPADDTEDGPVRVPVDPPEPEDRPATDHRRQSSTGRVPTADGHEFPDGAPSRSDENPTDESSLGPGTQRTQDEPARRADTPEPSRTQSRSDPEAYNTYRGVDRENQRGNVDAAEKPRTSSPGGDDDPPEEHRVDVDDSGFIFG